MKFPKVPACLFYQNLSKLQMTISQEVTDLDLGFMLVV